MGRQAFVLEVAGHVHANENHLKAADKIARHQQLEARVFEGLAQRLGDRLLTHQPLALAKAGFAQAPGQWHDDQHRHAQNDQCLLPAKLADQEALGGHHQKLAKRARRRRHTHRPRALVFGHVAPDHAVNHRVGRTGLRHANQHPGRERKQQRRRRVGHARQPQRVQHRARDDHPKCPKPVGHHARKNPGNSP